MPLRHIREDEEEDSADPSMRRLESSTPALGRGCSGYRVPSRAALRSGVNCLVISFLLKFEEHVILLRLRLLTDLM